MVMSVAIAFYMAYRSGKREQQAEEKEKIDRIKLEHSKEYQFNSLKEQVSFLSTKVESIENDMHKGFSELSAAYGSLANEMRRFFRGEYSKPNE